MGQGECCGCCGGDEQYEYDQCYCDVDYEIQGGYNWVVD